MTIAAARSIYYVFYYHTQCNNLLFRDLKPTICQKSMPYLITIKGFFSCSFTCLTPLRSAIVYEYMII